MYVWGGSTPRTGLLSWLREDYTVTNTGAAYQPGPHARTQPSARETDRPSPPAPQADIPTDALHADLDRDDAPDWAWITSQGGEFVVNVHTARGDRLRANVFAGSDPVRIYGASDIDGNGTRELFVQNNGASIALVTLFTLTIEDGLVQVTHGSNPFEFAAGDAMSGSSLARCHDNALQIIKLERQTASPNPQAGGTLHLITYRLEGSHAEITDQTQRPSDEPLSGDIECQGVQFPGA